MATNGGGAEPTARHQLMTRAAGVGLLMRSTINLGVSLIALADPLSTALPAGRWLLAVLAVWSLYRLATRSHATALLAVDYGLVLAVCLAVPLLVPVTDFHTFNTAPQAIAGTAVISFSVAVRVAACVPMAVGIAAAYAAGAASVIGWENVLSVMALYYFAVQCGTASIIRFMLLRVAGAIDQARRERAEAEVAERVTDAVRDYEREQLALLHDTAASTLMMVGQGVSLPPERMAAQARRDLHLLRAGSWEAPPPRVELVAALRDCTAHLSTPVEFDGRERLWVAGATANPVIAAAREAMNNVDRHARAELLRITVTETCVRLADDGIGFDLGHPRTGHGVDDSIIGRMARAGGDAHITSSPGAGTVVEMSWAPSAPSAITPPAVDPDRLIDRTRTRYGLALTAYSLVNLAITVPTSDAVLGILATLTSLAAIPGIMWQRWLFAWPAMLAALIVAFGQPAMLPQDHLLGYPHWAQGAIGWCVLPLMLALPTRTGAALVMAYWACNSLVLVIRDPSPLILVNIGYGTASILGIQLFALVFNGLMRDAATAVESENAARQRLLTRDRVSQALRAEYQRRYATIVAGVVPLLEALTRGEKIDTAMQLRARAECRRLRALFDQASTFDHPLMQRIRPLIDAAEGRRVDVAIDVSGTLPDLDDEQISALATPVTEVLNRASTSARIVVTGADGQVEISVVIDIADTADTPPADVDGAEVIVSGRELWCLIVSGVQKG
ncbi:ATP-binding protein [Mycolicibacterium sp. PAM1]|uniref:sensor histidine kinase n=1 Tax=Mycolicibacterium sp. PAM1 TaxID=2853535 RepID=UPI0027E32580|nr:ATP-binding protein [Mycolicibacterium sp. PAM1]